MPRRSTSKTTTLSSREFNQDTARAKKAAKAGPVFITNRGRPAHVLLSIELYDKLIGTRGDIIELLALPGADDIDIPETKVQMPLRPADLAE